MTLLRNLAVFVRDLLDPDRLLCRWVNDTHEGTDDADQ